MADDDPTAPRRRFFAGHVTRRPGWARSEDDLNGLGGGGWRRETGGRLHESMVVVVQTGGHVHAFHPRHADASDGAGRLDETGRGPDGRLALARRRPGADR